MHIAIETVDGQLFRSDDFDLATSGLTPEQFDEALEDTTAVFKDWRSADYVSMDIGGRTRYFNPVNVMWAEVVFD